MRVVTLSVKNSKMKYGGSYRRYLELMEGMLSKEWEVHHISPRGFSNISDKNFHHYGVYDIPFRPAYFPFIIQAVPRAISVARKHKIDVLVAFSMFDALIGIMVRLFSPGMQLIMCDRGNPLAGLEIRLREKYRAGFIVPFVIPVLGLLQSFVYRKADLVIFNSEARREQIAEAVKQKPEKTKLIYNNANPSWVVEGIEEAQAEAPKIRDRLRGRLVVFVGNLFLDGRDISTLLKAFKRVKDEIPQALLILVGEGPDREEIARLARSLGIEGEVILEGWGKNPLSYMLASDVLLVLALHEGFSNTLLEALYCRALVLGSQVGGITEALEYEDLLFPPKDEVALAEKIITFLNDPGKKEEASRLIEERRSRFLFDWTEEMMNAIQESL